MKKILLGIALSGTAILLAVVLASNLAWNGTAGAQEPTDTPTPASTDTPTLEPEDTPVPLTPVTVDSTVGVISGFFGSIDFPDEHFNAVQNVVFSQPLPSNDYVVLLTRVDTDCLPFHVEEQLATGFSFKACGEGGSVNWAVLVSPAGHQHWACRHLSTGVLRDTGVDADTAEPTCPRRWELIQIVVSH